MTLCCFVYTSVACHKFTDQQLADLFRHSASRNQRRGISGMLLYLDPYFIQILEGEADILQKTFQIIKQDERHRQVSLIYRQLIDERRFSGWTSGLIQEKRHFLGGISDILQRADIAAAEPYPLPVYDFIHRFQQETLF